MQTSYIYSVSRTNALSQFLLSKNDIERLLVADAGGDIQSALKETYLAPYIVRVPNEDLATAIELTLIEAKKLVHKIAPKGDMFRVLWIQYDIHNLRVLAKATSKQMSQEDYVPLLSERGVYSSEYLRKQVEESSLSHLQTGWQEAYNEAVQLVEAGEISAVDSLLDDLYFETSKRIEGKIGDSFMKAYLAQLIDLHNLKSKLRQLKNVHADLKSNFVTGGKIQKDQLETEEEVLTLLEQFGGADFWKEAIEHYKTVGNTTSIDARSAEYMLKFTKENSQDMFSSASLVLYYLKCRQAAANIRIIVVGKNSGMRESVIRANLRMAYVND